MTRAVQDIARSASEYSRVARKKPQKAQEAHKFLVPFVLFVVPVPLRCEFVHSFSAWGYIMSRLRGCIFGRDKLTPYHEEHRYSGVLFSGAGGMHYRGAAQRLTRFFPAARQESSSVCIPRAGLSILAE